ncbi:rod shape-determining protein RodA [candidate division KSB1 bacterium]|nr:rod shape-determining protein RodA [candidate division KSB1 bacterium]
MFTNKIKHNFSILDLGLIICMFMLISIGLISIYSATSGQIGELASNNFQRQVYWLCFGIILFIPAILINSKLYMALAYVFYGFIMLALIVVLIKGISGGGAARWLSAGGLRFQPSEWAKLATIFALARFLTDHHDKLDDKRTLLILAGLGILPFILIFKQPDLGTSLVFIAIIPAMLFWAGVSPLILLLTFIPGLTMLASFELWSFSLIMGILLIVLFFASRNMIFTFGHIVLNIFVGVITPFLWNSLEAYQQKRVLSFLGIVSDPKGISYQVIQSKVAIGSGGITGKGFLEGTQTQLRFLPEQHTDFIFSVIGEEFGILGCITVIVLFVLLISRGIQVASNVKNRFSSLVVIGITTMILYHYFVNLGMVMGLMPVTGLPLPFISYGGSFLNTCMVSIALILNFSLRRHEY